MILEQTGDPWASASCRKPQLKQHLTWLVSDKPYVGEQKRVFTLIPGLENAEFVRYGVMHRNSFVDSLMRLIGHLEFLALYYSHSQLRKRRYVEAIASGFAAALNMYARLLGVEMVKLPLTIVWLSCGICNKSKYQDYQPMHVNFGIFELDEHIKEKTSVVEDGGRAHRF